MSLTVCSPQLGLAPNSILGGEVFDREILMGLAKKGVKIEIILPKNKPCDKNIKNWTVSYLPIAHFPAILANLLYIPAIFSIYRKSKFQILRVHQPQFFSTTAIIFKLFYPNVKIVATYHQFKETKFWLFSKLFNNYWDHIICDSNNVKTLIMENYKVAPSKITVVHNGVPRYLKPAKKDPTLIKKLNLKGKTVLLFMGLFIERKTPLFLLDVLSNLNRTDVVMIFWGAGSLKDKIIKKARELSLADQIRIIDPVYGLAKNKIHNLADIFVHPSIDEGFALAPLEAMACAKPIIINNDYSAKEAVENGVNGFLCKPNDLDYWVSKISRLINYSPSRDKMGLASLKKVGKEFQWKIAVPKHIQVFKSLRPNI
ncbi:MAG: Glycosyl transferase group 1 [Berkelbacteria bacterium GW2011_GWA1_36_9]|uniref:Glycosyl transferase group 1 n=1 Tax=Berkelbacteria bacterium GW2011_GWA1_36_9 TaxID=1618331 RepID=A0A0G0I265_9BACT|nr:MAG: Glycosyl transferase group 1 [Berkelbacteria bacterium GW2011_GWA1_36_9]